MKLQTLLLVSLQRSTPLPFLPTPITLNQSMNPLPPNPDIMSLQIQLELVHIEIPKLLFLPPCVRTFPTINFTPIPFLPTNTSHALELAAISRAYIPTHPADFVAPEDWPCVFAFLVVSGSFHIVVVAVRAQGTAVGETVAILCVDEHGDIGPVKACLGEISADPRWVGGDGTGG